jgi:hypothetical protein
MPTTPDMRYSMHVKIEAGTSKLEEHTVSKNRLGYRQNRGMFFGAAAAAVAVVNHSTLVCCSACCLRSAALQKDGKHYVGIPLK